MLKSMPCGKCLFSKLNQQITRMFYSFVGTVVIYDVCDTFGYSMPVICTPDQLMGDDSGS